MRSGNGVRLGKIAGIPIILDFTFFIALALFTILLATRILPDAIDPDPSDATAWGLAIVTAVIFFTSLLLHELAHSVVALKFGLNVANITLFILGGVSQITEDTKSAKQEFLIAFVGPLTSAVLAAGFLGAFVLVGNNHTPLAALLFWLGGTNVLIAVFNMIPGFPLDGGRVFRSVLWGITGSRTTSTRIAARVGQGFGLLFAIFGVVSVLDIDIGVRTGGFGGIWLIFIGAFLYNAAAQSLRAVQVEQVLSQLRVRDVMSTRLRTLDADTLVRWVVPDRDALDPHTAFLVTESDVVTGIVTGSVVLLLDDDGYQRRTMRDLMIRADRLTPIAPNATGHEALERLQAGDSTVLPVVEDGRLLGLIGLDQVARALRGSDTAHAPG